MLLHFVDLSYRAGRDQFAVYFVDLGLRVYQSVSKTPFNGQVGFSDLVVRCCDWAGLLFDAAALLWELNDLAITSPSVARGH